MSVFDTNFSTLVRLLLPVKLRGEKMKAWLNSLVAPVVQLQILFNNNRSANLYYLAHNSQVPMLQSALNDIFDPVGRGILVVDGAFEDPLFTYLVPEDKPLWLGLESEAGSVPYADPQVLFTNTETTLFGNCFIVKVPVAVSFDSIRMNAVINKYRLPGKNTYSITTY
jgi:hypothetical protein